MDDRRKFSERWRQWRDRVDLDEYDARWDTMATNGESVHGEVDFVVTYPGQTVLDAGCGMGRVAIELRNRGRKPVGVDNDTDMLVYARRRAPELEWVDQDLATLHLGRRFDLIVMAGNILVFVVPDDRPQVVAAMAAHLEPGGRLITGSTYEGVFAAGLTLGDFDRWATDAGLVLEERYAGWDRAPYTGGDYAVSVHRRA